MIKFNYFYNLSLSIKTRVLILITAIGILLVGVIASFMMFGMKNNIDRLFTNRTLSLVKVQNIKDIYNQNLINTYRDILHNKNSYKDSKEIIKIATSIIDNRWSDYRVARKYYQNEINIFFSIDKIFIDTFLEKIVDTTLIDESSVYQKISKKIETLKLITDKIDYLFTQNQRDLAFDTIKNELYPLIDNTNIYLGQLTTFHLKKAIYEKQNTDMLFEATFWIIFVIIFLIVSISVFFAYFILENIKNINDSLCKKVEEKTKELKEFNLSLEHRIDKEIKQSRLKDEMIHQQSKLAQMGEMLGNIAHQWRQPLNALTMLIQTFELKSMNNKLTKEFISNQVKEGLLIANSMSDTINEFRNYFRPEHKKSLFFIDESIDNAIFLIDGVLKKDNIQILFKNKSHIKLLGYSNSFMQVIINLLNNSREILLDEKIDDRFIEIKFIDNKEYINISVIDNGGGVPENILNRIFEPYFTTKHQSSGTGIGLYMSKNIINNQFDGTLKVKNDIISLNNKRYIGARFDIKIPKKY